MLILTTIMYIYPFTLLFSLPHCRYLCFLYILVLTCATHVLGLQAFGAYGLFGRPFFFWAMAQHLVPPQLRLVFRRARGFRSIGSCPFVFQIYIFFELVLGTGASWDYLCRSTFCDLKLRVCSLSRHASSRLSLVLF